MLLWFLVTATGYVASVMSDFEFDRKAGLRTTAVWLGQVGGLKAMLASSLISSAVASSCLQRLLSSGHEVLPLSCLQRGVGLDGCGLEIPATTKDAVARCFAEALDLSSIGTNLRGLPLLRMPQAVLARLPAVGSLHGPLERADHDSSEAPSLLEPQTEAASVDETENPWRYSEGLRARFLVAGVGFEPTTFGL